MMLSGSVLGRRQRTDVEKRIGETPSVILEFILECHARAPFASHNLTSHPSNARLMDGTANVDDVLLVPPIAKTPRLHTFPGGLFAARGRRESGPWDSDFGDAGEN